MSKKGRDYEKYRKIYAMEGKLFKSGIGKAYKFGENSKLDKKWERYGSAIEGSVYAESVLRKEPRSILDVGCGYNQWIGLLKKGYIETEKNPQRKKRFQHMRGIKMVGVDIACPGADVIAPAHNMPFENNSFDMITSFDCMEHIPEEEVPLAIKEFHRIGSRVYADICLAESPTTIDGERLHVCVKSKEWWIDQFKQFFNSVKIKKENKKNTPHWKIVIYAKDKKIIRS